MILSNLFLAAIVLLIVGTVIFVVVSAVRTYLLNRGQRIVSCPETKSPAVVHIDAARAARNAVFGKPQLNLERCSQWPERKNCGQECLAEIHIDPAQCLARIGANLPRIASDPLARFTGTIGNLRCSRRIGLPCNGMKSQRRDCRRFLPRIYQFAGIATSRRLFEDSIRRWLRSSDGNAMRVGRTCPRT